MLESLFNKVAGLRPTALLKRNSDMVFSCEICEIFKNIYFEEYMPKTASGNIKKELIKTEIPVAL